jgi:hypothetical protein
MFTPQTIASWLSPKQVSDLYHIARQNVVMACKIGKFTENEAVKTSLGWLIDPDAANRLWQGRIKSPE